MRNFELILIRSDCSIRQAMLSIDLGAKGLVLVIDQNRRLLGTVTDGDMRRAILAGTSLDLPVQALLEQRMSTRYARPITARVGTPNTELLRLMNERSIHHIPLLDEHECVVDLVALSDLVKEYDLPLTAVVMAGGYGERLRPLTEDLPKPMLPIGDRPLMQLIIEGLQQAGITRVNITTHYQSEKIVSYFGDGQAFGVEINYVEENRPLGTAGALGLMPPPKETVLVINGDILTRVDFRAMLHHHRKNGADLTVAVRKYENIIPYGVIECDGARVRQIREKPQICFLVNAGIYLLEPVVNSYIPQGERFDMTDLIQRLLDAKRPVASFPIVESWLDIGQHADYQRAHEAAIEKGKRSP